MRFIDSCIQQAIQLLNTVNLIREEAANRNYSNEEIANLKRDLDSDVKNYVERYGKDSLEMDYLKLSDYHFQRIGYSLDTFSFI